MLITLQTTLEYEPKLSVENQRLKLVQWIDCVESAAETLTQLNVALVDIVNQTKLFQGESQHTYIYWILTFQNAQPPLYLGKPYQKQYCIHV